jgi:transcriptional regulator with XRE-family HTH domain
MSLGQRIKQARLDAKKTQEQLAEDLKVTKGAISQWENNQTVPELDTFRLLLEKTKASADVVLLGGDEFLRQLVTIYKRLTSDNRDRLVGHANRLLTEQEPGPASHDPFGARRRSSLDEAISKRAKRRA